MAFFAVELKQAVTGVSSRLEMALYIDVCESTNDTTDIDVRVQNRVYRATRVFVNVINTRILQ